MSEGFTARAFLVVLALSAAQTATANSLTVTVEAGLALRNDADRPQAPSLQQGVDLAAVLRQRFPDRQIIVSVRGRLQLRTPVLLQAHHSGTPDKPLIIRGQDDGSSRLSGSVTLKPIGTLGETGGPATLPSSARGKVLIYQMPAELAGRPIDVHRVHVRPAAATGFEVFDAKGPLQPARYPNDGWLSLGMIDTVTQEGLSLKADARTKAWAREPDLWLQGYIGPDWSYESLNLQGGGTSFRFAPASHYPAGKAPRLRIVHAASELDEPGEFYRDRATSRLYVWPRAGQDVQISIADSLIVAENAAHITLDRLVIEQARGDAVQIKDSVGIRLSNSIIRQASGRGIVVDGGYVNRIERSIVEDTGEGGITLTGGDRTNLTPGGHVAENTIVRNFARLGRTYKPGIALQGVGNHAIGNLIENSPHMAVFIAGNNHRLRLNEIRQVVTETDDAGAVYTGRDWTARGTIIENNLLHEIGLSRTNTMGIYLDDMASGFTVRGNVFLGVRQSVFVGGGRDNLVQDNVFVDALRGIHIDQRGMSWAKHAVLPGSELMLRMQAVPIQSPTWRLAYPRLAELAQKPDGVARGNGRGRNLFIGGVPYYSEDGAQFDPLLSSPDRALPAGLAIADLLKAKQARDLASLAETIRLPFVDMDRARLLVPPFSNPNRP